MSPSRACHCRDNHWVCHRVRTLDENASYPSKKPTWKREAPKRSPMICIGRVESCTHSSRRVGGIPNRGFAPLGGRFEFVFGLCAMLEANSWIPFGSKPRTKVRNRGYFERVTSAVRDRLPKGFNSERCRWPRARRAVFSRGKSAWNYHGQFAFRTPAAGIPSSALDLLVAQHRANLADQGNRPIDRTRTAQPYPNGSFCPAAPQAHFLQPTRSAL